MHSILSYLIIICLGMVPLLNSAQTTTPKSPNILVFFTDDQGYGDLGVYGAVGFETPNLDQLASEGILFTDFYVPSTVCTPSRAALLTGKYPKRVNLHESVIFPFSSHGLAQKEITLAEMLKERGYITACIGKWHLGHLPQFMPSNQGFDYFFGVPYSNDMNNYYYKTNNFQSPPLPLYRNEDKIAEDPNQGNLTSMYTVETIDVIKNRGDSPFFIYLAHNMPHTPLYVSEAFRGKSELGLYGDVIMELDWSMGEIVKALKSEGIYENTIILFTSDNGPVRSVGGSAGPLRGQKAQTWEGGQRVPAILTWPAQIPPRQVNQELVTTMDLFPTFASIVNYPIPPSLQLDGTNVLGALRNPQEKIGNRPFLYYGRDGSLEAIRMGKWKLHIGKEIGWDRADGPFPVSLYNLKDDIGEMNDLSHRHPRKVRKLKELMFEKDKQIISN